MNDFSFFVTKTNKGGAWIIRGEQIAAYLGAELNPEKIDDNDIAIYVKMEPPLNFSKHSYLDIVDAAERIAWLLKNPEIGVITSSLVGQEYLSLKLKRDDIVYIPHHHCNFERIQRNRNEVKIAGIITDSSEIKDYEEIKDRLAEIGVTLVTKRKYRNRFDCVEFYKQIDVQINWRPHFTGAGKHGAAARLRGPLKVTNAASYGIPTVSFPEVGYEELKDYYLSARTVDEVINNIVQLKNSSSFYQAIAMKGLHKAEDYHISKIAEMYKKLEVR